MMILGYRALDTIDGKHSDRLGETRDYRGKQSSYMKLIVLHDRSGVLDK